MMPPQESSSMPYPSAQPDAGVEKDVADVRDQLREKHDEHRHHRTGEQELDVVVPGRLDQGPAEALVVEERLGDDDTVQEPGELQQDHGEGRDERVPQRVFHDDVAEGYALEPGGAD